MITIYIFAYTRFYPVFDFMEVACLQQRRIHHPLDLLSQSDADLQHKHKDEDPSEEEDWPEDDQRAQVLHVLGEHPPEHHGSHPGRDEDDGGQGEAADHVLVRPPLPQCIQSAPLMRCEYNLYKTS